jgi:hypothetical protein
MAKKAKKPAQLPRVIAARQVTFCSIFATVPHFRHDTC